MKFIVEIYMDYSLHNNRKEIVLHLSNVVRSVSFSVVKREWEVYNPRLGSV